MEGNLHGANSVETEARVDVPNTNQQPRRKSRADNSSAKGFKRAYKACVRCRMSKAKCELPQTGDSSLPLGSCSKISSAKPSPGYCMLLDFTNLLYPSEMPTGEKKLRVHGY